MPLKILFDHESDDIRDALCLEHPRCEQLNKEVKRAILDLFVEDDYILTHAMEHLSKISNNLQEFTYCMFYFSEGVHKIECNRSTPVGAILGGIIRIMKDKDKNP